MNVDLHHALVTFCFCLVISIELGLGAEPILPVGSVSNCEPSLSPLSQALSWGFWLGMAWRGSQVKQRLARLNLLFYYAPIRPELYLGSARWVWLNPFKPRWALIDFRANSPCLALVCERAWLSVRVWLEPYILVVNEYHFLF